MTKEKECLLMLEDGTWFRGTSFGAEGEAVFELVFNTSMVGYQEILSDPSYTGQAVVMTYPLIGNYGMNDEDYETDRPSLVGLVVHHDQDYPSNFRCTHTLSEVMKRCGILGISGVDTRKLTRHIRDNGSCKALLTTRKRSEAEALQLLHGTELTKEVVPQVSTKEIYSLGERKLDSLHVVAIDCGMKKNIGRRMAEHGLFVTVVPWDLGAEAIMALAPDGVFLSNGPGDPAQVEPVIETVKALRGRVPIFGICLGNQVIARAYGASTYKLKFGHRGGNHPVKNLRTGHIEITSQNHSYAVDPESLEGTGLTVTHVNLLDKTVEGISCQRDGVFAVQYHPESAPGPQDSDYLFEEFVTVMQQWKEGHHAETQ